MVGLPTRTPQRKIRRSTVGPTRWPVLTKKIESCPGRKIQRKRPAWDRNTSVAVVADAVVADVVAAASYRSGLIRVNQSGVDEQLTRIIAAVSINLSTAAAAAGVISVY